MDCMNKLIIRVVFVWFTFINASSAQELEPRRWSHLPVDSNFLGAAYVHTDGEIFLDPVLEIEEGTVKVDTVIASYLRSFNWSGKTARFDVLVPYQRARWEGLLDGQPASVERHGLADPRIRLSINFIGAPALKGKEYKAYRAANTTNTIAGAALSVRVPLGQYKKDKLLNLGQNRFIIRPQIGVVHTRGPWSFELTGSAFFFTDNDEFFNGNTRKQEPLFAMQSHIIRTFRRGRWASISAGYDWSGQSRINGEKKDDRREDFLYALSAGMPVSKTSSIKIAYARGRTREDVGSDTDNIAVVYSNMF